MKVAEALAAGLALLVAGVVFAGAAAAQTRPPAGGFAATAMGPSPSGPPVDRTELAIRVAALLNSGQCEAARRASLSNGDYGMAHKAEAICQRRGHSQAKGG